MTTPRKRLPRVHICRQCEREFAPSSPSERICSTECRKERVRTQQSNRDRRSIVYYVPSDDTFAQVKGLRRESHTDCERYGSCLTASAPTGSVDVTLDGEGAVPCCNCDEYRTQDVRASAPIASLGTPHVGIDGVGEGNKRRGRR